jgi:phage-related protein
MVEPTDIEKKSLEAHVELCAERYNALDNRMAVLDEKISSLNEIICDVHNIVQKMGEKNTDRLISWGVGIIGVLVSALGFLISHYIIK